MPTKKADQQAVGSVAVVKGNRILHVYVFSVLDFKHWLVLVARDIGAARQVAVFKKRPAQDTHLRGWLVNPELVEITARAVLERQDGIAPVNRRVGTDMRRRACVEVATIKGDVEVRVVSVHAARLDAAFVCD